MTTESKYSPLYKAYPTDVCGASIADRTQLCLGLFMEVYGLPEHVILSSHVLEAMRNFQRWIRRMGILVHSAKDGSAFTMFCAPTDGSACWEQKLQNIGDIDSLVSIHEALDELIEALRSCVWYHAPPAKATERQFVNSMFVSPASPRNVWPTEDELAFDCRIEGYYGSRPFWTGSFIGWDIPVAIRELFTIHNKLSPKDARRWDDWEKEVEAHLNGEKMWCAKRRDVGTMRRNSL